MMGLRAYALEMTNKHLDLEELCPRGQECEPTLLEGTWGFEKGLILEPDSIIDTYRELNSSAIRVPSSWNPRPLNPFDSGWQEAEGVGTYWLLIDNAVRHHHDQQIAIQVRSVFSSYRVLWAPVAPNLPKPYVLFEKGWKTKKPLQSQGTLRNQFVSLPIDPKHRTYLLIIQVANTIHAKGGIRKAPILGPLKKLQEDYLLPQILNALLIGAILIIAIYHTLIFLQRREDKGALWLAVQCLIIALFVTCRRGIFEHLFQEPNNTVIAIRTYIEYGTHIFGPIAFAGFLSSTFPTLSSIPFRRTNMALGLSGFLVLLTPVSFFTRLYISFFIPVMSILVLYCFIQMIRHLNSDSNIKIALAGTLMLGFSAINDALHSTGILRSVALIDYAQVAFILLQGSILSHLFAKASRLAKDLSEKLQAEVERQTRDIKAILRNIKQGIFTIENENETLKIGQQRSSFLSNIIPENTVSFTDFMHKSTHLSNDQISQISETIKASQNEDEINFDCNRHLLPREIEATINDGERILEIDWSPMLSPQKTVERFLISLRDVTELRELQTESRDQREDIRILEELLKIPESRFKRFTRRVHEYLSQNSILIESMKDDSDSDRQEIIRQLFINMHTIKGTARSLHLQAIAAISHEVEQHYAQLKEDARKVQADHLDEQLKTVHHTMTRYEELGRVKLGWQLDDEQIKVSRKTLMNAIRAIASLDQNKLHDTKTLSAELLEVATTFETLSRSSLEDILNDMCSGLDSIARDLGKAPPLVHIDSSGFMLSDEGHDLIQAAFTHILRNAIDHGIEDPSIRKLSNKNPQGQIKIIARQCGDVLQLRCGDDGRGLDLEAIWNKAAASGIVSGPKPTKSADIADLIFHPGFSTKDRATEISGRGVGMDAVRTYLKRRGGDAQVELLADENGLSLVQFQLIITMPSDTWWKRLNTSKNTLFECA
jgi:HPt (histidine-containing phosphotransfer) domain-containing protein